MSSFQSRVWSQQQLAYCPHTSVSGDTWQCVRSGISSSDGSATTIVDDSQTDVDDTFAMTHWLEITSGPAKGQWKRVVDFANASGTFTLEGTGYSVNPDNGTRVQYRLWLSPEPVIFTTAAGSTTSTVAAARTEADDFWVGYFVVPIVGAGRGAAPALISAFVSSTGTFTHAALSTAIGDNGGAVLRKFIEPGDLSAGPVHEYIPRPVTRVNFSMGDGVLGPKSGAVAFSTQIRPSGTTPADGTAAGLSNVGGLFQAAGLEEVKDSSDAINDVTPSTSVNTMTTIADITVGNMVGWDGNFRFASTLSGDDLTILPVLPDVPLNGDLIQATRGYVKSTDGDGMYGVLIEWEVDGIRTIFTGCKGNVTFNDGAAPVLAWDLQADHWIREVNAAPYSATSAYGTVAPVLAQNRRAWLDAVGTDIAGFTATPGSQMAPRPIQGSSGINGRSGFQVVSYQAGGTFRELSDSTSTTLAQEVRWLIRTGAAVSVVYSDGTDAFGIRIPAGRQIESPHPADEGGLVSYPIVWEAQDAGFDANVVTTKVPDFGFFIT